MMKDRKSLLGTAMAGALGAALLCGAGAARAQGNDNTGDFSRERNESVNESVIVRPDRHIYNKVQRHTRMGRVNGEINPTELSLSRPVSYADLDLSRGSDFQQLRVRVRDTARGICAELDAQDRGFNDQDSTRECVNTAIRGAMAQVPTRPRAS